jgi:hypothetical protein
MCRKNSSPSLNSGINFFAADYSIFNKSDEVSCVLNEHPILEKNSF